MLKPEIGNSYLRNDGNIPKKGRFLISPDPGFALAFTCPILF